MTTLRTLYLCKFGLILSLISKPYVNFVSYVETFTLKYLILIRFQALSTTYIKEKENYSAKINISLLTNIKIVFATYFDL